MKDVVVVDDDDDDDDDDDGNCAAVKWTEATCCSAVEATMTAVSSPNVSRSYPTWR